MSVPTFTPGPWDVAHLAGGGHYGVFQLQPFAEHRRRFLLSGAEGYVGSAEQARANADLIAAAPDLYEALASLVEPDLHYDGNNICIPNASHIDGITLVTRARAALAKARGQ